MPSKRFIIIAVTIWVLGIAYLGPKAFQQVRTDLVDNIEGRVHHDGAGLWNSLRGIMFPSFILRDLEE